MTTDTGSRDSGSLSADRVGPASEPPDFAEKNQPSDRGRRLPLPQSRHLVIDLLHFSRKIHSNAIARDCLLPRLAALRESRGSGREIGWAALFLRAYGLLSARHADLRRCYMPWPWPHLYEHPFPVGRLTVSRRHEGEMRVFFAHIERPDLSGVAELQEQIDRLKHDPVENIDRFRKQVLFARFPALVRRAAWWITLNGSGQMRAERCGTFGVTSVAAGGAFILHPPSIAPITFTYGPVDAEGRVRVTMAYDHRQLDGMSIASFLRELEQILDGEVADELEAADAGEARKRLPR